MTNILEKEFKKGNSYISIYTRNSVDGPSDYYRVIQYTSQLNRKFVIHDALSRKLFQLNLNLKASLLKKLVQVWLYVVICIRRTGSIVYDLIYKPEIIIVQREIFPRWIPCIFSVLEELLFRGKKIIWDFDDEISAAGEISKREKQILEINSSNIIVTSGYLKKTISYNQRYKVDLLPTTDHIMDDVPFDLINQKRLRQYKSVVRIVWVGTSSNLYNINRVIDYIDQAAKVIFDKQRKQLILTVVSNIPYKKDTKYLKICNREWSRENAADAMLEAHIGIMPLVSNRITLGKGGFKLIQYLSAGLPIIGSDVGYNRKIINSKNGFILSDDMTAWVKAIVQLSSDEKRWLEYSKDSLEAYNRDFNYEQNLLYWKNLLRLK